MDACETIWNVAQLSPLPRPGTRSICRRIEPGFLERRGVADVRFVEVSGATKAIVDGRLDAASVDALETRFLSGVMASGSNAIVDLSGVSFIASLGIRMLLSAARALRNRDRKLAIFGASAVVMEIIQSTALSDVIPVLNSEAEALATLSP